VLATVCDRALFVVRGFGTDRGMARRGAEALRSVGAHVAGLVLNHADSKACRYYGSYGEEYSYAYASPYLTANAGS
jgi:Mrp family chromosome partitioning ATPase